MRQATAGPSESTGSSQGRSAPSPLDRIVFAAAEQTAAAIALRTRRPLASTRQQIDQLVAWLVREESPALADGCAGPPVVPREYVDMLRASIVARLRSEADVDACSLVRLLARLEELTQAWRRTDRGSFVSRLTGINAADAVVAIAHDIRSPLSSILILVDSLRRGQYAPGDPARERQLAIIYGAAQGLGTLASDLIDAARVERLSVGPPAAFSVTETLSAVAQILLPVCEERALPLRLQPPAVDGRIGHQAALHRVLLNLASNALRCTETGHVSISCTELSPTLVEFSVADTGAGIAPEMVERLFDGFSTDGSAMRFSRTGLGLVIVRTLLDAMGSSLSVESTPAAGTRFFFQLDLPHAR